jgi:protein phosphatase
MPGIRGARCRSSGQPVLIVLCGPSHSGKSTFARRLCRGCTVISSDRIRKERGAVFGRCQEERVVWEAFESEKGKALREGRNVVLDACHLSRNARRHALQGPNARHRKVCVVFDVPLSAIRKRCVQARRLSVNEAERMWRAFQACKPTAQELRREGFEEVYLCVG